MCTKLIPELSVLARRVNTITTLGCIMTKASCEELSTFTFPFQTNCYDASCAVCGATFGWSVGVHWPTLVVLENLSSRLHKHLTCGAAFLVFHFYSLFLYFLWNTNPLKLIIKYLGGQIYFISRNMLRIKLKNVKSHKRPCVVFYSGADYWQLSQNISQAELNNSPSNYS